MKPALGRNFLPEEERQGGDTRAVLLTEGFWARRFGSDPSVLRRRIRLDGAEYTIVGVLPKGFRWNDAEILATPLDADPVGSRGNHILLVIGRLKANVSIERAHSELASVASALARDYPASNRGWSVRVLSFYDWLIPDEIRNALTVLMGAVVVVLLIACVNVANLLLARISVRQKELSIRVALGAARGRIVRQLMTESLVVSLLAALIGLLGAASIRRLLVRFGPAGLPRLDEVTIDLNVFLFTLGASVATTLLFGIIPAIGMTRRPASAVLQDVARGSSRGRDSQRLRAVLTVAEVAFSVALLIGAGLLLRSFWQLQQVEPGFNSAAVTVARVAIEPGRDRRVFYERLLSEIQTLPGVVGAAASTGVPLGGGNTVTEFEVPGMQSAGTANWRAISPGYFAALGIPFRGLDYSWSDRPGLLWPIIISQSMARTHWPNQDPIGKTLTLGSVGNHTRIVVGVAGDVRHNALDGDDRPMVYYSTNEMIFGDMRLLWRSAGDPGALTAAVRESIRHVDPSAAMYDVRALDDVVSDYFVPRKFNMYLLGMFATVALILTGLGLFGVTAYLVSQRTREIGVRVALGANRQDIFALVLRRGLALSVIGVAIGLAGASWLTRVMQSLLFSVSVTDPATFVAVPLVLMLVSFVACYLPARRAARVDPLVALRYE